jgi:outer membrane immunogenic protein
MGALMRKQFLLGLTTFAAVMLGGAAHAADMPVKAPPPAPAPVMYNWTGFYIGGHIGGAWVNRDNDHRFDGVDRCFWGHFGRVCFDDNGRGDNDGNFIAGGQIGFNYQIGQWVWGVEGQISAIVSNNDDDHGCGFFTWNGTRDHLFRCRDNNGDWVATAAVRLGIAVGQTGNWLLYVKGGAAFADSGFDMRRRSDCAFAFCSATNDFFFNDDDDVRVGWMVGAGIEWGAWGNWSWKLEWNFMDFGNDDRNFDHFVASCECRLRHRFDFDTQVNVVKFGLNYRFGYAAPAAPVAARY